MDVFSFYDLSEEKGRGYVGLEAFLGALLSCGAGLFRSSLLVQIRLEQQRVQQHKQHSIGQHQQLQHCSSQTCEPGKTCNAYP